MVILTFNTSLLNIIARIVTPDIIVAVIFILSIELKTS